jgi:hypothetical protein
VGSSTFHNPVTGTALLVAPRCLCSTLLRHYFALLLLVFGECGNAKLSHSARGCESLCSCRELDGNLISCTYAKALPLLSNASLRRILGTFISSPPSCSATASIFGASSYRSGVPRATASCLCGVGDPTLSGQSGQRWRQGCLPYALYSPETIFLVSTCSGRSFVISAVGIHTSAEVKSRATESERCSRTSESLLLPLSLSCQVSYLSRLLSWSVTRKTLPCSVPRRAVLYWHRPSPPLRPGTRLAARLR